MSALVALFLLLPVQAQGHHSNPARAANAQGKQLRPGCYRHYKVRHSYRWMRKQYHRDRPLERWRRVWVTHLIRCVNTREKSVWLNHRKRHLRARFRARLAYYRLTPYAGPGGTRWAIPWYIVSCESGGSWGAYNPSGAVGPYQLLGWGAIYPARTFAEKLQNHRIASQLWNGGAGASNWVCA